MAGLGLDAESVITERHGGQVGDFRVAWKMSHRLSDHGGDWEAPGTFQSEARRKGKQDDRI